MANHDDSHVFILSAQFFLAGAKKKVFQTEALPCLSAGIPTRKE
jgi:hypothetical protein